MRANASESGARNEQGKSTEVAAFDVAINSVGEKFDKRFRQEGVRGRGPDSGCVVLAAAEAQQSTLPPVNGRCPRRAPASRGVKALGRISSAPAPRCAAPRAARSPRRLQAVPFPNAGGLAADRNPYADPAAPYKATRVQASGKFPEPMLNTPKSITVLSKEVLADKNITSLREVGRSTAGVTLGSGEGGNAFGDRFFIRGFDARNDVFIDGIRDPAVSIRENFFTEQIEILRGPASSYAGRGTAGGAINIVTKQAGDRNFYNAETRRSAPTAPSASRSTSTR